MQVLILEDYFPLQQELVAHIEKAGHQVFASYNATEATEILKATQIDAVIADILVKEDGKFVADGGILLINRLRENFNEELLIPQNVPILAISAASDHITELAVLDTTTGLGANAFLRKPLDVAQVLQWLEGLSVAS